jgi:ubiquinone/menaquinone biosynthesis C-methylase UbiE
MPSETNYRAYNDAFFGRYAPVYDYIVAPLSRLRRDVVAVSGARPGQTVLDVACGTGEQTLAFARAGCSVVGVDLSADMLARARAKAAPGASVQFLYHDASSLPFDGESFDVVTISLALHDMPLAVARDVLAEMRRVVKPHGTVVVVDYATSPRLAGRLIHAGLALLESKWYHHFMREGLANLIRESGMAIRARHPRACGAIDVMTCSAAAAHAAHTSAADRETSER